MSAHLIENGPVIHLMGGGGGGLKEASFHGNHKEISNYVCLGLTQVSATD